MSYTENYVNNLLQQLRKNKNLDSQIETIEALLNLIKSGPLENTIGKTKDGLPVIMLSFGGSPLENEVIKTIFEFSSLSQDLGLMKRVIGLYIRYIEDIEYYITKEMVFMNLWILTVRSKTCDAVPALLKTVDEIGGSQSWRKEFLDWRDKKIMWSDAITVLVDELKDEFTPDQLIDGMCVDSGWIFTEFSIERLLRERMDCTILDAVLEKRIPCKRLSGIMSHMRKIDPQMTWEMLVCLLEAKDLGTRVTAAQYVGSEGDWICTNHSFDSLCTLKSDPCPEVRCGVLLALAKSWPNRTVDIFKSALTNETDAKIRLSLLTTFANSSIDKGAHLLITCLNDPDQNNRKKNAYMLANLANVGKLADSQRILVVERLRSDSDPQIRADAVACLRGCRSDSALLIAIEMLQDNHERVIVRAAEIIGEIGTREQVPMLENAKERILPDLHWLIDDSISKICDLEKKTNM